VIDQQLGNYEVLQMIGEGGMGIVYQAEHLHLKRAAAIIGVACANDTLIVITGKKVTAWSIPDGTARWTSTIFPAYPTGSPLGTDSNMLTVNCS
jgi:hypothetical protein